MAKKSKGTKASKPSQSGPSPKPASPAVETPPTDPQSLSLLWPTIAAVGCVFVVMELALHGLIPGTALKSADIPFGARLALLCYASAALSAFFLGVGALLSLFGHKLRRFLSVRLSGQYWTSRLWLTSLIWTIVVLYGSSWAKFWHTQKFLSTLDFAFIAPHPIQIFHWIGTDVVVVVLGTTLIAAALITELIPRWIRTWSSRARERLTLASGLAMGLFLFGAAVGELYSGFGERQWTHSGILYAKSRDQSSGPLAYLLAGVRKLGTPSLQELSAPDRAQLVQRPIIPMEQYVAGIDRRRVKPWNVILLMVESLGAKQLRAYGGNRDVMPSVEALARESRVFLNTYTQASHTDYATPVPLSGHYPLRSATVSNYPKNPSYPRVLIYDLLKAIGYRTAIFSSSNEYWGSMINYLQTGSLDRLFHAATFKGPTYVKETDTGFAAWVRETHHAGSVDDRFTTDEGIRWIDSVKNEPFFLYMNFQNSHLPYTVPDGFPRRFSAAKIDFTIRFGVIPKDKIAVAKDVYADSLSYVDAQIARLFQHLRSRGLWERTLIVLTGDHGQAFYEHGFAAHAGAIFNEVMKVPLIVQAPGMQPGLDDRLAQHADLSPSILDLLGLPPHPSHQGISLFSAKANPNRSIYMVAQTPQAYQYGIVRNRFKLIYDEWAYQYQLYDLISDPAEENNLTNEKPDLVRDMAQRLQAWRKLQIDYYANQAVHSRQYPPVLVD